MLPRIATKDSRLRVFQYKLLSNVLYLKKMLFRFGKIDWPLCSFCKAIVETPLHLFHNCTKTKLLWDQLKEFISNETLSFPSLTLQSAILGHIDLSDDYSLINHLIPIYKFYIYNSRQRDLTLSFWKQLLIKLKGLRKKLANMNLIKDLSILWNSVLLLMN